MDDHFQNISYDIIQKFLNNVSDQCLLDKQQLWALWSEMFQFPIKKEKAKKEKVKSDDKPRKKTPTKANETVKQDEVKQDSEKQEEVKQEEVKQEEVRQEEVKQDDTVEQDSEKEVPLLKSLETSPKKKEKSPESKAKKDTCVYVFTKGDKVGQACGKAANKKKSDKYCTTHFKE